MKTVKETSNYGLFKTLNGNRPISESPEQVKGY